MTRITSPASERVLYQCISVPPPAGATRRGRAKVSSVNRGLWIPTPSTSANRGSAKYKLIYCWVCDQVGYCLNRILVVSSNPLPRFPFVSYQAEEFWAILETKSGGHFAVPLCPPRSGCERLRTEHSAEDTDRRADAAAHECTAGVD